MKLGITMFHLFLVLKLIIGKKIKDTPQQNTEKPSKNTDPANTTEWMAPIRAQAKMATANSGIIGK